MHAEKQIQDKDNVVSLYPAHYSQDDIKQIADIKAWMAARDYKQAALARLARISSSSLSQILGGTYATPPGVLLLKIVNAMKHADDTAADSTDAVETGVYRLAMAAFQMARRYRNFSVLSAFVGTGKTFAAKHYQRTTPNTYLVEATPTMTVQSLVKLLARLVIGFDGKGGIDDKFRAIVDELKNTDSLLIIDEAETLTPHVLNTLRRLRDMANIGIALVGTEHLSGIVRSKNQNFDQIRSRIVFWPETIERISADDAAALVEAGFSDDEVPADVSARMYAYSQGSARMLAEAIVPVVQQARAGRELSVALVDAAVRKALCLKPLA